MGRRTSKKMDVPIDFYNFADNLAEQISRETGMVKNRSQALRLMAKNLNGRMVFRKNKFDFKIF